MSDDWNRWPAQEPPDDFADRAVAAMLRTDRAPRRMGGRWFIPLAAAAILVGSASWARITSQQVPEGAPVPSAEPAPEIFAPELPLPPTVRGAAPTAPEPEPEVKLPPPRPRPSAPAVEAPPESEPDAGTMVVVPRCICEHGTLICSCVE